MYANNSQHVLIVYNSRKSTSSSDEELYTRSPFTQEFQDLLEQLRVNPCQEILIKVQFSDVFAEVKSRYDHFCEATRNGDLGGTLA